MISVKTAAAEIVKTVEWQELRHNELFSAPGGSQLWLLIRHHSLYCKIFTPVHSWHGLNLRDTICHMLKNKRSLWSHHTFDLNKMHFWCLFGPSSFGVLSGVKHFILLLEENDGNEIDRLNHLYICSPSLHHQYYWSWWCDQTAIVTPHLSLGCQLYKTIFHTFREILSELFQRAFCD